MKLFGFTIYREKPGVISKGPCWVCFYGYWMHADYPFWRLIWNVVTEFKNDRHLVG